VGVKPSRCHRIDEASSTAGCAGILRVIWDSLPVLQFKAVSRIRPIGSTRPRFLCHAPQTIGKLLPSAHAVDREFKVIEACTSKASRSRGLNALCSTKKLSGRPSTSCR